MVRASDYGPTGFKQKVDGRVDKIPEFDPRKGDHFWITIATYNVNPTQFKEGMSVLDGENLVLIAGPICYYCENTYSALLATRRCRPVP